MFFYKKMEKRKQKNIPEKTQAQLDKEQNIKNAILLGMLVIALGTSVMIGSKLKKEVTTYDDGLIGYKDINEQVGNIKPLYKDEDIKVNYDVEFEFENIDLYLQLTDKIYEDAKPYYDEYKNIYLEFNKEEINYIEFHFVFDNFNKYFYLTNDNLYISDTKTTDITSLQSVGTEDVSLLFELVSHDIPTDFSDYVDYIVGKEYYKIENDIEFDVAGKVMLNNGEEKQLSLVNFLRYIEIFHKESL